MDISKRIVEVREGKHITQTELARKLEMEQSNYSRLEKRGDKLTVEQLERIAQALDVTVGELLGYIPVTQSDEIAALHTRIRELEIENERLNGMVGFVKQMMDLVNSNPQKVAQLEQKLFDGDDAKKERIRGDVMNTLDEYKKERK